MALGQADLAIELLGAQGGREIPGRAGGARDAQGAQAPARAAAGCWRRELGKQAFARENAALRDVAGAAVRRARCGGDARDARRADRAPPAQARAAAGACAGCAARCSTSTSAPAERPQDPAERGARASASCAHSAGASPGVAPAPNDERGRGSGPRAALSPGPRALPACGARARASGSKRCTSGANASRTCAMPPKCSSAGSPRRVEADATRPAPESAARGRADDLGETLGEDHDLAMLGELVRAAAERKRRKPALAVRAQDRQGPAEADRPTAAQVAQAGAARRSSASTDRAPSSCCGELS